jgi:hypothetical protein
MTETEQWARDMFGGAELGDSRRTARLVNIAARAAENPSGKLSEVFTSARELDAAYDFVERDQTSVERLERSVGRATAAKSKGQSYVFVPVDGSSVNLVDGTDAKGFGSIGTITAGAQGLKVMSALAIGADGIPIGPLAQTWWSRPKVPKRSAKQKSKDRRNKKPEQKETRFWKQTIEASVERLDEVGVRGWFQLDREADAWPTLLALATSGHLFTVRSAWDRLVQSAGHDKQYLRALMAKSKPMGFYELDVPGNASRSARRARMVMHAAQVTLHLRDKLTGKSHPLIVNVVWVHEQGTTPSGEKPLDWMLLTNAPIDTVDAARAVVLGYSVRWRIEEFHKTWKSGGCKVELTQLRSRNAVIRWAIILAVVATRIERLKRLGRGESERPATDELTLIEIQVLIALKRVQKKRTESVPDGIPTMGQAMRWIADLGGYTGKSSGGPPGSITIGRGLKRLQHGVEAVHALREARR